MPLSPNAVYLLKSRYCNNNEEPENVFKRTAEFLAKGDTKFEEKMYNAMINGVFLPNSPALFNSGFPDASLHACYILPIEDSLADIFASVTAMAKIFQSGGGVGINFSKLREKDALLSKGGKSSGAISFMGVFDNIVEVVKQGGKRRGALMGILNYSHPEIFDFVKVKLEGKLQNFNLSIMVTDDFMEKVESGGEIEIKSPTGYSIMTVKAKDVFELMAFASWVNGDPALLFYDRINKDNPLYPQVPIDTCNPCVTGDTLIATADGREAVSILRLEKEGKDVPVYCADNDGFVHIRYARKIRKTGSKVKVFKVTLDDGSYIKTTENHNFILKNGNKIQAKDLKEGDSLLRFDKYTYKYHNESKTSQDYWGIQRARNNCFQEHRLMKEFEIGRKLGKTEVIHHRNSIGLDNYWSNLEIVDVLGHSAIHDIYGNRNPINKLKKDGKFEEWKSKNSFFNNEGAKNPMYGKKHSEESKKKNSESHIGKTAWNKGLTKETSEKVRDYSEKLKVPHSLDWNEKVSKGVKKYYEKQVNHKVVSVEFCGYEDVYNMTVDDFHNYAVITSNEEKKKSGIIICNCSEVAMPYYSACCLGSINLSKFVWKNSFNFDRFSESCQLAMRTLTNMNDLSVYPLPEIAEKMKEYNPVGVGIMGFADCLIKLGIKYDSQDCLDFIDKIGAVYKESTLAYNPDNFYFYRRIIAPTGSLSILADCSSGIEPVYDVAFERSLTIGKIEETRDLYKSQYVRTAHQVSPEWHVKVVAQFQKWIDGGASKTVNMPYTSSVDDIKNIYKMAWKEQVKGITVYRDGSRNQVLTSTSHTNKFEMPKAFAGKCSDETCTL